MTKAKAKMLVSELIERGYAPQISENAGAYTILVSVPVGIASTGIAQVESLLNVTASIFMVSFN